MSTLRKNSSLVEEVVVAGRFSRELGKGGS